MGDNDVTLYAIYKKTLTGTFIDYNGTTKSIRTAPTTIYNKATSGTIFAPAQNTYSGWTKRGWSTSTASNASVTSSYTISSDTTYYGLYQRTLTLSYNANGGSFTPSSQTGTQYANSYSISTYTNPSFILAAAISKSGSTFGGWAKSNTSGTVYSAGSSISISENTMMYARWNSVALKVKSVSVSDVTLNYKSSTTLKPQIIADEGVKYTVKYESLNTKVATVDKDGKVYGAKKGSADIKVTVTDTAGNIVTDTCKVNVKYSFGQWLIIIFLFGWIWY